MSQRSMLRPRHPRWKMFVEYRHKKRLKKQKWKERRNKEARAREAAYELERVGDDVLLWITVLSPPALLLFALVMYWLHG